MSKKTEIVETGSETAGKGPLSSEQLDKMNAYWRAANYLSVGQIYLKDNPLLERPLTLDDVKPRLLGHWGTTPGLNFLYVHWNRLINERNLVIASASEEQAQVSREVDRNLVNIRDLASQSAAGANQTSAASHELSRLAVDLNTMVARFVI